MPNTKKQIYMDYAATHPLSSATKDYIISILDMYGNPSSQYELSDNPRKILFYTRKMVANFINANINNVYFTSSGSASNSLGIKGYLGIYPDAHVYYSPIAHKSILKCLPKNSYPLNVSNTGMISDSDLEYVLCNDDTNYKLVVIDYANSEIGTIQRVRDLIDTAHRYGAVVMLDVTGSIPYIPIDVDELSADMVTFSGHKLGALKGVGVLYKKKHIELEPLICGAQEFGLFGGTENIIGIASLYSAIAEYDYLLESYAFETIKLMWTYIKRNIPNCYLIGEPIGENRLTNNLYICFKGIDAETLVTLLSSEGIYVSTGSACNSGNKEPSSTLTAIKLDKEDLHSCIRITVNHAIDTEDAIYACKVIKGYIEFLRG